VHAEEAQRREWDAIASLDAYWAVLSVPERKHGQWSEEEFFDTGRRELAERLKVAADIGIPQRHRTALDFGCGLGRITRELARNFERCVAVDISEEMLARARQLNAHLSNIEFTSVGASGDLPFAEQSFDLVYSSLVLQHLPGKPAARAALGELARITAPGGLLCFQLPTALGLGGLQPRRTAYRALRAIRIPERTLYERFGLHPIRMLSLPRAEVESLLGGAGAEAVAVRELQDPVYGVSDAVYYATRR
jgi:SAM-dependent methyltransferase